MNLKICFTIFLDILLKTYSKGGIIFSAEYGFEFSESQGRTNRK